MIHKCRGRNRRDQRFSSHDVKPITSIERLDATKNIARYYAFRLNQTCSATLAELGRIGAKGQMMVHHFGREEEAVRLFLDPRRKKRRPRFRPPTMKLDWGRTCKSLPTPPYVHFRSRRPKTWPALPSWKKGSRSILPLCSAMVIISSAGASSNQT
ncbi:hypothetical protein BMJ35_20955 [Sinorhizobium medicae]|nr:hypothetical protein BMJ35_20955 [Sinorhizobium medicae]